MGKENSRTIKIAELIHKELAQLIQQKLRDERIGLVTISEVALTKDLSLAKIFVTIYNVTNIEESLAALKHAAGFLRSELAKRLPLRTVPKLFFYYDDTLDKSERINELLDSALKKEREQKETDE